MGFDRLSCSSCSLISGLPSKNSFHPSTKVAGALSPSAVATTVMLFPALTLAILTKNLRPRTLASLPEIRLPEGCYQRQSQPIIISAGHLCLSNRRDPSERLGGGLRSSGGVRRLTRAFVVCHPKRPRDPG